MRLRVLLALLMFLVSCSAPKQRPQYEPLYVCPKVTADYIDYERDIDVDLKVVAEWWAPRNAPPLLKPSKDRCDVEIWWTDSIGTPFLQGQLRTPVDESTPWILVNAELLGTWDPNPHRVVLAHELGHALGLPHGTGIMVRYLDFTAPNFVTSFNKQDAIAKRVKGVVGIKEGKDIDYYLPPQ